MKVCPNCKGHKGWPVWDSPKCGMCEGRGEITDAHLRTFEELRDLQARLGARVSLS